ncbi:hypothetical protein ABPG73_019510 [Tetrahymena malaccensis]
MTEKQDLCSCEENQNPVQVPRMKVNSGQFVLSSVTNRQFEQMQLQNDEIKEDNNYMVQIDEQQLQRQQSVFNENQNFEQKILQSQEYSFQKQSCDTDLQEKEQQSPLNLDLKLFSENLIDSLSQRFKSQNSKMNSKGIDPFVMKNIKEQVENSVDFLKFYQDMIFIKKAIMMILSKEQFAALQLVGCSEEFFKLLHSEKKPNEGEMNYFEQQFAISLSQESQLAHAKLFLSKILNQEETLSEIDKRIYSSLI